MRDPDDASRVHLPADRAFVVQFTAGTPDAAGTRGRVEHLASGAAARFESLAHLEEFFIRVLARDAPAE